MDYAVSLHIMSFNNIFSNAKIHIFYVFSKSVMQNLANNGKNNGKMRLFNRLFAHPPSQRHNNSDTKGAPALVMLAILANAKTSPLR